MKVWNKEINSCSACDMYSQEYDCGMIGMFHDDKFDAKNGIFKNCPFNQRITKEAVIGFGFEIVRYIFDDEPIIFEKKLNGIFGEETIILVAEFSQYNKPIHISIYEKHKESKEWKDHMIRFFGSLRNLQELEFMLKTLMII